MTASSFYKEFAWLSDNGYHVRPGRVYKTLEYAGHIYGFGVSTYEELETLPSDESGGFRLRPAAFLRSLKVGQRVRIRRRGNIDRVGALRRGVALCWLERLPAFSANVLPCEGDGNNG